MEKRAYIICATPRSGTTLLTDLLSDTGVAGCPDSFFRVPSFPAWADYLGVSRDSWPNETAFDRAYLEAVRQAGRAKTTIFGMRLMEESRDDLCAGLAQLYPGVVGDKALLLAAFGAVDFIHLVRQDKLAQAISLSRAEQSGLWHVDSDGAERERLAPAKTAVFNFEELARNIEDYKQQEASWVGWFADEQIQPLKITYEDLSQDPIEVVRVILEQLDLDPGAANKLKPRTKKLADAESLEWARRFNASST
ncbi:MAG: Stf0 family sulfotransferase [Pseudomonadota bacterium]